jgi:transposase
MDFPMATKHEGRPNLQVIPMLAHETVYVGGDIGKHKHVAGFVSKTLLERHGRFEACPAFTFEQSREGFRSLIERIQSLVPLTQIYLIFEHTGHYHRALEQYLLELDLTVYRIHVQKRPAG